MTCCCMMSTAMMMKALFGMVFMITCSDIISSSLFGQAFMFNKNGLIGLSTINRVDDDYLSRSTVMSPSNKFSGNNINTYIKDKKESFDYDYDDNNDLSDEEEEIEDKPRYRSKLQRLNQLQSKKIIAKLKTRPTKSSDDNNNSRMKTSSTVTGNVPELLYTNENDGRLPSNINEDYGIDSFLRGEYWLPFADDAAAPLPKHSPNEIVEIAIKALRDLDVPTTDHGAAVFMRFLAPLSRNDRWGGSIGGGGVLSSWKAILRGALTPTMLARRIRASEEFAPLLDWERMDVTEGTTAIPNKVLGYDSTVAFVNAGFFFGDGVQPCMCQFTLKMYNGVWLIDSAVMNKRELFIQQDVE